MLSWRYWSIISSKQIFVLCYIMNRICCFERFRSTLLIWGIWLVCAFMYYGVIIFTTELFVKEDSGERCPEIYNISTATTMTTIPLTTRYGNVSEECISLSSDDYRDAFIQSIAELPVWRFCLSFIVIDLMIDMFCFIMKTLSNSLWMHIM